MTPPRASSTAYTAIPAAIGVSPASLASGVLSQQLYDIIVTPMVRTLCLVQFLRLPRRRPEHQFFAFLHDHQTYEYNVHREAPVSPSNPFKLRTKGEAPYVQCVDFVSNEDIGQGMKFLFVEEPLKTCT